MPLDDPRFELFARHRRREPHTGADDLLRAIGTNIDAFGWHCQHVYADPGRLCWSYTIGFGDTFDEPDLVVFGLDTGVAGELLNALGDAIADGATLTAGERYDGFLPDGLQIGIGEVQPRWAPAYFGRSRDWYGEWPACRQVLLPDTDNLLPDDLYSTADRFQLVLSKAAPAPHRLTHPHTPIDIAAPRIVVAPDWVGDAPTGWLEEVVVTPGIDGTWVVACVPFVNGLVYGDEVEAETAGGELRFVGTIDREPVATVRMPMLRGGDDARTRIQELLDAVDADESTVWESPVPEWLFFGVPHDRFDWFRRLVGPLGRDGILGVQVDRPPPARNRIEPTGDAGPH